MENLIALKQEVERLVAIYRAIGATNVVGLSFEDQVKADVAYKIAEEEWLAASNAYQFALREYAKTAQL